MSTPPCGIPAAQVPAGEQCVLQHVHTGSFLSSDKVPYMTLFGPEFEVPRGSAGLAEVAFLAWSKLAHFLQGTF